MTRDTVWCDTFARAATSAIVGCRLRLLLGMSAGYRAGPAQAFLAAVFLVVFFAAVFLVVDLLAALFFAPFLAVFVAGPLARRSASSSAARSRVIASTESSLRSVALYSPSVTYSPNRPAFTTTGCFETGSSPSSLSGAAAAARPRCLGWA